MLILDINQQRSILAVVPYLTRYETDILVRNRGEDPPLKIRTGLTKTRCALSVVSFAFSYILCNSAFKENDDGHFSWPMIPHFSNIIL